MAISTTSFNNTPQATTDLFTNTNLTEDNTASVIVYLDVMANDLGGAAKTLYSLDNGDNSADLLTKDTGRAESILGDHSANGAAIWITADNKVGYDASKLSDDFVAKLQQLGEGESLTDTFTYAIRLANGTLSWTTATVQFAGVNDAPVISGTVSGTAFEDGQGVTLDALAHATDADVHDVLSVTNVPAELPAGVSYDIGTHSFSLDPTDAAYQHLAKDESVTITVKYDVSDGHVTREASVTFVITGTNDAPTVAAALTSSASEDDAAFTVDLLAGAKDVDDGAILHVDNVSELPAGLSLEGDVLKVDTAAFQHLAAGKEQEITVTYNVIDEHGATVPQTATITIIGTNDAPTVTAALDSIASEDDAAFTVDLLAGAKDVDDGAILHVGNVSELPTGLSLEGNILKVDTAAFQHLAAGKEQEITVTYNVIDEHGATVAQTATITVTGANDGASITVSGPQDSSVSEASRAAQGDTSASGSLVVNDIDDGESHFQSLGDAPIKGTYGSFTFNAATGTWSYTLDNSLAATQALNTGDVRHDTLIVASADGSATYVIDVTVNGANDNAQPVITTSGILFSVNEHLLDLTSSTPGFTSNPPAVTVIATDADHDSLTFSLLSDSSGGAFQISANGTVSVKDLSLLDYESATNTFTNGAKGYELIVQVSDGINAPVTQNLYVEVKDVVTTLNNPNGANIYDGGNNSETVNLGYNSDIAFGDAGNDILRGDSPTGNSSSPKVDKLYGGAGDDQLFGEQDNDQLFGGTGSDLLIGGVGSDDLSGGLGTDTFKWLLDDQGASNAPAIDTISDFGTGGTADVLDLKDLLKGESHSGLDIGNLDQYLDFSYSVATGNTTISVHTNGTAAIDQKIILSGMDLTGGGTLTDAAIIHNLLNTNQLVTG